MKTISALLAFCAGISPVTGEFPTQRPVTRSFDVFFDLRLNKRLSKLSWGWWFETPSNSFWRHCNVEWPVKSKISLAHGPLLKEWLQYVLSKDLARSLDIVALAQTVELSVIWDELILIWCHCFADRYTYPGIPISLNHFILIDVLSAPSSRRNTIYVSAQYLLDSDMLPNISRPCKISYAAMWLVKDSAIDTIH